MSVTTGKLTVNAIFNSSPAVATVEIRRQMDNAIMYGGVTPATVELQGQLDYVINCTLGGLTQSKTVYLDIGAEITETFNFDVSGGIPWAIIGLASGLLVVTVLFISKR